MASATERVLQTTELLEDILLKLDLKTLLLSQRVNKKFQATIEGSLRLQQALFFAPDPTELTTPLAIHEARNSLVLHPCRNLITPEGHMLNIEDYWKSNYGPTKYCIAFKHKKVPPAMPTGSWKKMRTHRGRVQFDVMVVQDWRIKYMRYEEKKLEYGNDRGLKDAATFGDLMEA